MSTNQTQNNTTISPSINLNKSKRIAYLLWVFFGLLGGHKFYLNKTRIGILYFLTLGGLGIGWFLDLYTLWEEVDHYNTIQGESIKNTKEASTFQLGKSNADFIKIELQNLHNLKEKGILSDTEFINKKAKIFYDLSSFESNN